MSEAGGACAVTSMPLLRAVDVKRHRVAEQYADKMWFANIIATGFE